MNRYRSIMLDYSAGRILRTVLVALISIAITVSGMPAYFSAFAEDGNSETAAAAAPSEEAQDTGEESAEEESAGNDDAADSSEETQVSEPSDDAATQLSEPVVPEDSARNNDDQSQDESEDIAPAEDAKEENANPDTATAAPKAGLAKSAAAPKPGLRSAPIEGEAKIGDKVYASIQEAVEEAVSGAIIEIMKDITLAASLEIKDKEITISDDGNARTIRNAEGASAPLFTVKNGATLTLNGTSTENLKLQGGTATKSNSATVLLVEGIANIQQVLIDGGFIIGADSTGAVTVKSGGLLNMSDGVIENTNIYNASYGGAAVVIKEGAHFEMSGGAIRNNSNYTYGQTYGSGGVALTAWNTKRSTMNMSGGTISGNYSYDGGGIFMTGSSELHMTGGSIEGNTASHFGGGICVSGLWASGYGTSKPTDNDSFIFEGGNVSNNAARTGGGIYVNSNGTYLKGGYIENNSASNHGGGVYLSTYPYVLHVSKAVITDNHAKVIGGGIWSCPTGDVEFEVTDGVAVYNNTAAQAGDDLVMQGSGWIFSSTTLTLPDRMLGGGEASWYKDGATTAGDLGSGRSNVPRFDADNPGDALHFDKFTRAAALKVVTTEEAIERANEEATLFIRNNTAARGGGIGTNGGVTLAKMGTKDWSLVAEKKWDGVDDYEDKEVRVFLKIGDQILDSVVLNKDNGWKASFNGLPDPSTLKDKYVTVVEGEMVTLEDGTVVFRETSQYNVGYMRVVMEDDSVIYVLVTNSPIPEEEEPKEIVLGDYTPATVESEIKTADTGTVKVATGVPTGDNSDMAIYLMIMIAAAIMLYVIGIRKRSSR